MEDLKRHCSYLNGKEVTQEHQGATSGKRGSNEIFRE
jgi:hypothetical protein